VLVPDECADYAQHETPKQTQKVRHGVYVTFFLGALSFQRSNNQR
jgi:hypothetical protein